MTSCRKGSGKTRGFTLIELMIVVAIIGVLASIAIPKFADMITHAKEAATKGQLGSLRSALNVYYSDNEGMYPASLSAGLTTNAKYMGSIAAVLIPSVIAQGNPGHFSSNLIDNEPGCVPASWDWNNGGIAWRYYTTIGTTCFATLIIDCTHNDSKGTLWSSY